MHIAICDDNVADRKQLERLLKRESDKRAQNSGILYVDSYGHPESLLTKSMQYDAFFIDICKTEGLTGIDVVTSLTGLGNAAPIILCSSLINYREYQLPERVLFLDKPIKVAELSSVLDDAQKIKDSSTPLIELRDEKGTYYVTEPDIVYAIQDGAYLLVSLKDGRSVKIATTAVNFFAQIEQFPVFFSPGIKSIVNGRYIENIRSNKITMEDGTVFKSSKEILPYAKYIFEETRGQR